MNVSEVVHGSDIPSTTRPQIAEIGMPRILPWTATMGGRDPACIGPVRLCSLPLLIAGGRSSHSDFSGLFHTLFNLCNICLLIGFAPHLGRLVEKMVKPEETKEEEDHANDNEMGCD